MSDPRRLLEDPATLARLRGALQNYPTPTAIAPEALQALGNALGQTAGAASAAPTGTALLAKIGFAKIAVAIAVVGIGAAGIYAKVPRLRPQEPTAAVTTPTVATGVTRDEPAAPSSGPAAVRVETLALERAELPLPSRSAPLPTKASPSQLQAEAALLEAARRALATDPAQALEQTTRHHATFADPLLALERNLVEMDAHCRLGQRAQAEALAAAFRAGAPQVYAQRTRALLAQRCGKEAVEPVKAPPASDSR
jgi:hypothetical protein